MDVGTLVARSVTQYRDRIAVESEEGTRTFGEIGGRIFQLSATRQSPAEEIPRSLSMKVV